MPQVRYGLVRPAPVRAAERKDDGGHLAAMRHNDGAVPGSLDEAVIVDTVTIEEPRDVFRVVVTHGAPPFRRSTAARGAAFAAGRGSVATAHHRRSPPTRRF